MQQVMKHRKIIMLAESAIMIALASVLSVCKIIDMPYGGSVTLAAMLPIAVIALRYGTAWGLATAFVNGCVQLLLGLDNVAYGATIGAKVVIILFDYVIAYAVVGFAGMFRNKIKSKPVAFSLGCLVACVLRYACHALTGATVWKAAGATATGAWIYSLSYNITYMLPEAIVLIVAGAYLAANVNFDTPIPTRRTVTDYPKNVNWMAPVAGFAVVVAAIVDTVLVFPYIQDAETGDITFANLASVNWIAFIAVTAVAALVATLLLVLRKVLTKKEAE